MDLIKIGWEGMDWIHHAEGWDKWWVLASEKGLCSVEFVLASWKWLQKCENVLPQGACLKMSVI